MASWLQAQLKAAEGLLEAVDKTVVQTVNTTVNSVSTTVHTITGAPGGSLPGHPSHIGQVRGPGDSGLPLSTHSYEGDAASFKPRTYVPPASYTSNTPSYGTYNSATVPSAPSSSSSMQLPSSTRGTSLDPTAPVASSSPIPFSSTTADVAPSPSESHQTPGSSALSGAFVPSSKATSPPPSVAPTLPTTPSTPMAQPLPYYPATAVAASPAPANTSALDLAPLPPAGPFIPAAATAPIPFANQPVMDASPASVPAPARAPSPSVSAAGAAASSSAAQTGAGSSSGSALHSGLEDAAASSSNPNLSRNSSQPLPTSQASLGLGLGSSNALLASAQSNPNLRDPQVAKVVEQLRKRLEASHRENQQLEELLHRAEEVAERARERAEQLTGELQALQEAKTLGESSLQSQVLALRREAEEASERYEVEHRRVLKLEADVAALEEASRLYHASKDDMEGGMVEALKRELSSCEARLDAERRAHSSSKAAAASRERDLEASLADSAQGLSELQRGMEEASRRTRELEDQVALLEAQRRELEAQVAAGAAGGGGASRPGTGLLSPLGTPQRSMELDAMYAEIEQQRRAAQVADQARAAAESKLAAMAEELERLRLDVEQFAMRKDTSQLEAQLREVSDMLYLKQTQMERLAADKAAQHLRLERELEAAREELARTRAQLTQQSLDGRALGGGGGHHSDAIIPMDALGEPYQRLARHSRVGRAVKAAANFLDSTASTTAFVLRQYPLGRLAAFVYLLLIHLYVYAMTARLQRQAMRLEGLVGLHPGGHDE